MFSKNFHLPEPSPKALLWLTGICYLIGILELLASFDFIQRSALFQIERLSHPTQSFFLIAIMNDSFRRAKLGKNNHPSDYFGISFAFLGVLL